MVAPIESGEVVVELCGVRLALRYKTKNMRVFSRISNMSLGQLLMKLQQLEVSGPQSSAAIDLGTDLDFLVSLIAAGVAHHKEFENLQTSELLEKIENLIDSHAMQNKLGIFKVGEQLFEKILPPFFASIGGPQPEGSGEQGNDQQSSGA